MTAMQKETAKRLEFDITAPLSMGLSQGKRDIYESEGLSPSLRFTIHPAQCPRRQEIWLAPKDGERNARHRLQFDSKTWRLLGSKPNQALGIVRIF
jgi:hypothetical protein